MDTLNCARKFFYAFVSALVILVAGSITLPAHAALLDVATTPLFLGDGSGVPPLNLLVMDRSHKIYYEAYNDASDLTEDGFLDVGYSPTKIDYYGYFDSFKCYTYDTANQRFNPSNITANKKCTGKWSGDFLNYMTMARIDAMRKVLYGGKRLTDSTTETVLERSHVPQDAHSWGKEYSGPSSTQTAVQINGYDIAEYTPLTTPATGKRHLFANTTVMVTNDVSAAGASCSNGQPCFRVLTNSSYRIWDWVSKEQPVAGRNCNGGSCAVGSGSFTGYANNHTDFDNMVLEFANATHLQGTRTTANGTPTYSPKTSPASYGKIDCGNGGGYSDCNPATNNPDEYYLTVIKGTLNITVAGSYRFAVDGDDAVEVIIDGAVVSYWYGGHARNDGVGGCTQGTINLSSGAHSIEFRHQEAAGGDSYNLWWRGTGSGQDTSKDNWSIVPTTSFSNLTHSFYDVQRTGSVMTDYAVRVKVCDSTIGLETNCRGYGSPAVNKPIGLLQQYGDKGQMLFGLLTGTYTNNLAGGVLRNNIANVATEINASGQYKSGSTYVANGIIKTLDSFKTDGLSVGADNMNYSCGWIPDRPINNGECSMWGNPIGEMMYEGLRYFKGATASTGNTSTSMFSDNVSTGADTTAVGLPQVSTWDNPYWDSTVTPAKARPYCSRPYMTVISDINNSFDSDNLPGVDSNFGTGFTGASTTFDARNILSVSGIGDTLWSAEFGSTKMCFIGQSGATSNGAPTAKSVSSFGNIRGLAPEGPNQRGSYYPASIAHFGRTKLLGNPVHAGLQVSDIPRVNTFSVALASPLPKIVVPVGTKKVTLVPFAKTVGSNGSPPSVWTYQPTDQIVDFYVDYIKYDSTGDGNSTPHYEARFRINYEDVEQGADHDMDAIALYRVYVNSANNVVVEIDSSGYASGSYIQHMGYVISGTTADGAYLEVKDMDTPTDVDYALDTHPGKLPGQGNLTGDLPLVTSRIFTPSTAASDVQYLKDPLWYAAKYGGFKDNETKDSNNYNVLDDVKEWDGDGDGVPDNYFLVTNPLKLETQLENAFLAIIKRQGSASAAATNTTSLSTDSHLYQATFWNRDWMGDFESVAIDSTTGNLSSTTDWRVSAKLALQNYNTGRNIFTYNRNTRDGVPFRYTDIGALNQAALNDNPTTPAVENDSYGDERLDYLRGDTTNDGQGLNFRERGRLELGINSLGDIVHSAPVFVGNSQYANPNRTPMVYVGSNDGMLHGFRADSSQSDSGKELMAYVPGRVFPFLNQLTNPSYIHRYYIDGQINVNDAQIASVWKTVLTSSLGFGGQGIFALDVTDPNSFTESATNAANLVLWEFSDSNDADLGYVHGQAQVVKMNNGQWAVVFGNGYNNSEADGAVSTTGKASLFIAFLDGGLDGTWTSSEYVKIIAGGTGVGSPATPNGLSAPSTIDTDKDGDIDYIYAGDLLGNLWKFDVTSSTSSSWGVAFSGSPFFQAVSALNQPQPITSMPEIYPHPTGTGYLVYIGTGKYLEKNDNTGTGQVTQSVYGLWDAGTYYIPGRSALLKQTMRDVTQTINGITFNVRVLSQNPINWDSAPYHKGWYIDLHSVDASGNPLATGNQGERAITDPTIWRKRLIFTTLIPSTDICRFGGDGYVMQVDAFTGGRTLRSPFDFNGDNQFTSADYVTLDGSDVVASGARTTGIPWTPVVMAGDHAGDPDHLYVRKSNNETEHFRVLGGQGTGGGRQSWRQLR